MAKWRNENGEPIEVALKFGQRVAQRVGKRLKKQYGEYQPCSDERIYLRRR